MTATAATSDLAALVKSIQQRWSASAARGEAEERWFAALELVTAEFRPGDGRAVVVLRDAYGQRFGWIWPSLREPPRDLDDPDWEVMLMGDLMDDLLHGGWTEPGEDGVRWLLAEVDSPPAPEVSAVG